MGECVLDVVLFDERTNKAILGAGFVTIHWKDILIQVSMGRTLLWILMLVVPTCQASFCLSVGIT